MNRIARLALLLLLVLLPACTPAHAEPAPTPCPEPAWTAERGRLAHGLSCDGYLASTDATDGSYTMGLFRAPAPVRVPFELTVRWRRLGAETRTLEVNVSGGVLLLAEGKLGFWTDDSSWEHGGGWQAAPAVHLDELQTLRVRQRADAVEATLDGQPLGRWPLAVGAAETTPAIGFKAPQGARGRVQVRSLVLVPLQRQTAATSAARPK